MKPPGRGGIALLEVLVSLAIGGLASVALAAALGEGLALARQLSATQSASDTMDRVMSAMSLLDRQDLLQRAGTRTVGEFTVDVQSLDSGLFKVRVAPITQPGGRALTTLLWRPAETGTP